MSASCSWQEGSFSQLLQQMSLAAASPPPTAPSAASAERSTALSHAQLSLPPPSSIALLSALAPRATDSALALLDSALLAMPASDLLDATGLPLARPRLLRDAVSVKIARRDGRAYAEVSSSVQSSGHLVLLSGVGLAGEGDDRRLCVGPVGADDAAGRAAYFSCSCRAFEFKHAGEALCKHIMLTGLAVVSDLAAYDEVDDEEFVAGLNAMTAGRTGSS